jgi:hypothetical protein
VQVSGSNISTVSLYAFVPDSSRALMGVGGNTASIPPSSVYAQVNGGAMTAFSPGNTPSGNGAGVMIYEGGIPHTSTVSFQIDISKLHLPAGAYTGTMTFQVSAI